MCSAADALGVVGFRSCPCYRRLVIRSRTTSVPRNSYHSRSTISIQKHRHDASHGTASFERLTSGEKWVQLHGLKVEIILDFWHSSVDVILSLSLDALGLYPTDSRCPAGCCRLWLEAPGLFEFDNPTDYPSRIGIIGAEDWEQNSMAAAIEDPT